MVAVAVGVLYLSLAEIVLDSEWLVHLTDVRYD